ncbi:uncharacterized protein DFL_008856 [Arthrobotrys flagrans]|uniref:Uncharacterized protein n=1 Tax=Arthrobotrys flagrans TaxID=97331 RepID=A0A436ZQ63_ARTFL|nr:hypothetical protein DFL_008856 [Arthrobotrys flagrans]
MSGRTKIAVVTDAFKGLGDRIVRSMLHNTRQPLTIYITKPSHIGGNYSIDLNDDQETAKALEESGSEIKYAELDVENQGSIKAFRDHLQGTYGASHGRKPLSILVNSAAQEFEDAKRAVDITYFGSKNLTRLLLPIMKRDGDSRIVNVSVGGGGASYWIWKKELADRFKLRNLTGKLLDDLMREYLHYAASGKLVEQGWAKRRDLKEPKSHLYIIPRMALAAHTFLLAKANPGFLINVSGGDSWKFANHVYGGAITPTFLALGSLEGATGRYWIAGEAVDWETNKFATQEQSRETGPSIPAASKSRPSKPATSKSRPSKPRAPKSRPSKPRASKSKPSKPRASKPKPSSPVPDPSPEVQAQGEA